MLELIILGEVPGTSFIISFSIAMAALTIFIGGILLARVHKYNRKMNLKMKIDSELTGNGTSLQQEA